MRVFIAHPSHLRHIFCHACSAIDNTYDHMVVCVRNNVSRAIQVGEGAKSTATAVVGRTREEAVGEAAQAGRPPFGNKVRPPRRLASGRTPLPIMKTVFFKLLSFSRKQRHTDVSARPRVCTRAARHSCVAFSVDCHWTIELSRV